MFGDADLASFFVDFGVAVTFGSQPAVKGIFDKPMQNTLADMGYGGVVTEMPAVHLPYNAFSPMPEPKQTITVNGTSYTVSVPSAECDGAIVTYQLKAVAS